MENLIINGTKGIYFSPQINFNAATGVLELTGESYLENTFEFYNRVIDWLSEYLLLVTIPVTFNMKITYFNTSSSRALLDIFVLLKEFRDKNNELTVNWYYDPDNKISMQQEVEDFEDEAEIKMNFLPLEARNA